MRVARKSTKGQGARWKKSQSCVFNPISKKLLNSKSALHKEMLAVLAAAAEVIRSQGRKESDTEYFAVLLGTLESTKTDSAISATMCLINMVMPRVPASLIRAKFDIISDRIRYLLGSYISTDCCAILRAGLTIAVFALRQQNSQSWNENPTVHLFTSVLMFIVVSKARLRKFAQKTVFDLLTHLQTSKEIFTIAGDMTARFCNARINYPENNVTPLHCFTFLGFALPLFTQNGIKSCCESILKAMKLGRPRVIACGIHTLMVLFASESEKPRMQPEFNAQIINNLYDFQPSLQDPENLCTWVVLMQSAFYHLHESDEQLFVKNIGKVFQQYIACLLAESTVVHDTVEIAMMHLTESCIAPSAQLMISTSLGDSSPAKKIVEALETSLKYPYHVAWGRVLRIWGCVFFALGKVFRDQLVSFLPRLANLKDTENFTHEASLEEAIGAAVRTLGPRVVLEHVPLKITGGIEDDIKFPRSWLLPLLRRNIRDTDLSFFFEYFMPLAITLSKTSNRYIAANQEYLAKTYEHLSNQCWDLLPPFCNGATDLKTVLPNIVRKLGTLLTATSSLCLNVLAALRHIVRTDQQQDLNQIASYSKNYMPIFFNLYAQKSTENDVRLALLDTIKVFVGATDEQLCCALFDKALINLEKADESDHFQQSDILDIFRELLVKLDLERVAKIMVKCKQFIEAKKDCTVQKKSYRLLEEVLQNDHGQKIVVTELSVIEKFFADTLEKLLPASHAPRLRCMRSVVELQSVANVTFVRAVLAEAVLYVKGSIKAREDVLSLIVYCGDKLVEWNGDNGLDELMTVLTAGLGTTPHSISCSMLAITKVFQHYQEKVWPKYFGRLCSACMVLMRSDTSEVVRSALRFIASVSGQGDLSLLGEQLPSLTQRICSLPESHRKLVRLILIKFFRKFGFELMSKVVPKSHKKVMVIIRKIEDRKSKRKAESAQDDSDDDLDELIDSSDDDLPDDRSNITSGSKKANKLRKNKLTTARAWIQEKVNENVVDLLDSKAGQNITGTNPDIQAKGSAHGEKSSGFKRASDGRFINNEDDSDSDDGGAKRKRKMSDSDDESDDGLTEACDFVSIGGGKSRVTFKSGATAPSVASGSGQARKKKKLNLGKSRALEIGKEYRSNKAAGDMKRKGKPDPFAYVPMNRQFLNKRKKAKMQGQFKNIVKAAQKGAQKGRKARK